MSRERPVVTDTGPLIHLSEANTPSLLDQFDTLVIPETVFEELRRGGIPEAFESLDCKRSRVKTETDRWPDLDPGETAALELCEGTGATFLTNDLDARGRANELGIEVHGSIGVVLATFDDNQIDADEAKARIRSLERGSSLYLSEPLVARAIARIDEESR